MLLQFGGRTVAGLRRAAKIPSVGKRTTRHPGRRSFFTSSILQDAPTISGIPERSLVDEGLSVEIAGLDPDVKAVTLHLNVNNSSNLDYDSTASFSVGPSGKLSLDEQTPILWSTPIPTEDYGGTMDLFRSLKAKGGSPNQRFWSSDVALPYNCTLSVHGGVRGGAHKLVGEKPLASAHFKRSLLAKGVKRKDLRQGRVVATMFVPESATACAPKPCVFTIHGGHNRRKIVEDNAALMASRLGFPTIALAFFGVETLPQKLLEQDIDVDYFEEAIDLATSMDEVRTEGGVGLWGISKGGEVCLGLSALLGEKIGAAVIVNCVMKPVGVGFSYRGAQVLKPQALESSADAQPKILGENLLSIAGTDGKFLSRRQDNSLPQILRRPPLCCRQRRPTVCLCRARRSGGGGHAGAREGELPGAQVSWLGAPVGSALLPCHLRELPSLRAPAIDAGHWRQEPGPAQLRAGRLVEQDSRFFQDSTPVTNYVHEPEYKRIYFIIMFAGRCLKTFLLWALERKVMLRRKFDIPFGQ